MSVLIQVKVFEDVFFSCEENSASLGVPSSIIKDMYHAFPSNLSQILEEEERQSSRNSVEKETERRDDVEREGGTISEEGHDDESDLEHDPSKCAKDVNDNNNNDEEDNLEWEKNDIESVTPDISDEKTSSKRKISRT